MKSIEVKTHGWGYSLTLGKDEYISIEKGDIEHVIDGHVRASSCAYLGTWNLLDALEKVAGLLEIEMDSMAFVWERGEIIQPRIEGL